MTSVTGTSWPLQTLRVAPQPGEIGHPGTCPLCTPAPRAEDANAARATPPCLACRDELRARLSDYLAADRVARALN